MADYTEKKIDKQIISLQQGAYQLAWDENYNPGNQINGMQYLFGNSALGQVYAKLPPLSEVKSQDATFMINCTDNSNGFIIEPADGDEIIGWGSIYTGNNDYFYTIKYSGLSNKWVVFRNVVD